MSKLITLFCFLSTLFCSYAVAAESVTEYPYSENFDNTAEKEMPSGWAVEGESPFAVYPAFDWYGVQAQSGANALVSGYPQTGNRTDVAYIADVRDEGRRGIYNDCMGKDEKHSPKRA